LKEAQIVTGPLKPVNRFGIAVCIGAQRIEAHATERYADSICSWTTISLKTVPPSASIAFS
jgi:hypothetical protein